MLSQKKMFNIAAWSLIAFGFIHEASFVYTYFTTVETTGFVVSMTQFHIEGTGTHLYSFYGGYGILMGLLLIAYGFLCLQISKGSEQHGSISASVIVLNIIISLAALVVSVMYFVFFIPIVLTGLATLFFVLAYIKSNN